MSSTRPPVRGAFGKTVAWTTRHKHVTQKKQRRYAGFEQMTKSFDNAKVLCLNVELELKSEKELSLIHI